MKIVFSGSGTLGPVTPLLAIHDVLKEKYPQAEFVWVGTKIGPERELVEKAGIKFFTLASGKYRRYVSFWNIVDIFKIIIGFFQSLYFVWQEKPALCVSAGGFVSVPLHWAAWLFGVPAWIHQQDVEIGLSNKLMVPFAKMITTVLERNISYFPKSKTSWLGNPVRQDILQGDRERGLRRFNLKSDLPVVFATGGGTGSMRVNQLVIEALPELKAVCQVLHLSGRERPQEMVDKAKVLFDFYQVHQFFTEEMKDAYAVADIVISRGGFGSLSEIAALSKPAIIIPKPGHQEENIRFLAEAGAVILVDERTADGNYLAKVIKELLADSIKQKQLAIQLKKIMPIASEEKIIETLGRLVSISVKD